MNPHAVPQGAVAVAVAVAGLVCGAAGQCLDRGVPGCVAAGAAVSWRLYTMGHCCCCSQAASAQQPGDWVLPKVTATQQFHSR
ncbi:hypothetical protein E2C01_005174 [Portunus trituberculatus]|uniref:Secreted protein n=1 Tax=Portunus trituberculatus TaxID=210409 RepID=A0A5B7CTB1_PORTR|nr:hypothetical protein [Portunus trituberculatus]